jgi:hypothetical protein
MMAIIGIVFGAGVFGGIVNALISDNGFVFPRREQIPATQGRILRPGFLGNMLIGGIAAVVSWGLYGPAGTFCIKCAGSVPESSAVPSLTVAAVMGALLVGVAGARWLTNEVDKNLLKAAAAQAAVGGANPQMAAQMAGASPAASLRIARGS